MYLHSQLGGDGTAAIVTTVFIMTMSHEKFIHDVCFLCHRNLGCEFYMNLVSPRGLLLSITTSPTHISAVPP
jgi:hypothetical protein